MATHSTSKRIGAFESALKGFIIGPIPRKKNQKKEEEIPEKYVSICHYWFRKTSKKTNYLVNDLCLIICLFAVSHRDQWDLSIKGAPSIHIDQKTGRIQNDESRLDCMRTVFGTMKIVIGPSNKYPCIHEWYFDEIATKKCIVGLDFVHVDLENIVK